MRRIADHDASEEAGAGRRGPVARLRGWVPRHRGVTAAGIAVGLGLLVFVLVWFQPQKLFIDERVSEALPSKGPSGVASAPAAGGTRTIAGGTFQSLEHSTTGTARIVELADGTRYLRLEDLRTDNGPDLVVYLSRVPAGADARAYGSNFVSLGRLKGNIGDQNYLLPDGIDLSSVRSAVIWCRRFTVGFGVAPLDAGAA